MIGYHGTDEQYANRILRDGFEIKERSEHWLGQGIYFYDKLEFAKWWAEHKCKSLREKFILGDARAAVIAVKIVPKQFLDLDSVAGLDLFFRTIRGIYDDDLSISFNMSAKNYNDKIKNFCLSLDLVKAKLNIDVVRYTFSKKQTSYGNENILDFVRNYFALPDDIAYKETQICISSNDCIVEKEICYREPPPSKRRRTW